MSFAAAATVFLASCLGLGLLGPLGRNDELCLLLYLLGFGCMWRLWRPPEYWSNAKSLLILTGLGIAGRLLLLPHPPSNDVYRYVWEGAVQLAGHSPYAVSPLDALNIPALAELAAGPLADVHDRINHPDLSAAYPPLAQLAFRALAGLTTDPWAFKAAMAGLDCLAVALLALAARACRTPPGWLAFYACNPLVVFFLAGEGHLDAMQSVLLAGMVLAMATKRPGWMFGLLGAAVGIKYFAAVGLPFLVTSRNWRKAWWFALTWLSALPFALEGGLFSSLLNFGRDFHYNDLLPGVLRWLAPEWSTGLLAGALAVALALVWLGEPRRPVALRLAFGALLLCLPTLHPWYVSLLAPLLVIAPSAPWLAFMAALGLTFPVVGIEWDTGVFQELHWLKPFIYAPLLVLGFTTWGREIFRKDRHGPVSGLSVVVPALNEAGQIGRCLAALKQPGVGEVIVADGGSSDATRELAQAAGATVVESRPGRGGQIAAGVERSSGQVVWVVHADAVVPRSGARDILRALNANPWAAGGAMAMGFTDQTPRLSGLAWLNNLRARLAGLSFGDQAQFFRRYAVRNFPDMALMEDVELSLRLKEAGGSLFLRPLPRVRVQARRWAKPGFGANVWLVVALLARYLAERRLEMTVDPGAYYRAYYGRATKDSGPERR